MSWMKLTAAKARAWLLLAFVVLTIIILVMMMINPALADTDLFKTLSQAIIITGLINLAGGFYFTDSNRPDPDHQPRDEEN